MKVRVFQASRDDRPADRGRRPVPWFGLGAWTAAAVVTAMLGLVVSTGPSTWARAGDEDKAASPAIQATRQAFVREMQRTLKKEDDRLIVLARQVLEEPDSPGSLAGQVVNARIAEKRAQADYLNAKLVREVAEIAFREYKEGIYVEELQTVEGEVRLARDGLERARRNTAEAKERLTRITALTDNSVSGLNLDYLYTDRLTIAEFQEQKDAMNLEQAESKKKVLQVFTYPKRLAELKSDLAKARSDELAKQVSWELAKGKLDMMLRAVKNPWPASDIGKRLLALIDRAMPIEEQAHVRLDQLAKASDSGESLQKEIRELTNELRAIIDEAEAARSASDFARLKPRIRQAKR